MSSNADNPGEVRYFLKGLFELTCRGGCLYYGWLILLSILLLAGILHYIPQLHQGLVVTNMREQVSWGLYISNFSFLVGVAAAAVLLVIPAHLYHFKAIKKIVAFGELLAVTAVIMALLFVLVDTGRPDRSWHALPLIGSLNLPHSILAWDIIVLNGYLLINLIIVIYFGSCTYFGKEPNRKLVIPLILLSIPWAIVLHSVTAFVYNGLVARPFWNASILAPRFLASAFCSGPSLLIIIFQIMRKVMDFNIRDAAIFKLAEMVAYAMAINLFLQAAEVYKEFYSDTLHFAPMIYLFAGLHGHSGLVPWIWTATIFSIIGFLLFLIPKTRKNFYTLNIGCVLLFIGIWIEKGLCQIVPGFIPDALGEIYEYMPSRHEIFIAIGIWAAGAMLFTVLARVVIAIDTGRLRYRSAPPLVLDDSEGLVAVDIMTSPVLSITQETPIEEIRSILVENRISGVPVVNADNKVVGVVSETDIVYSLMGREPQLIEQIKSIIIPKDREGEEKTGDIAAEVMSSPAITAEQNTPLLEVTQIMIDKRIKRVIIADAEGRAAGIVSQIDIVKAQSYGQPKPVG